MSDYSELKSLLEYAIGYRTDKTTAPDVQKFCRLTELTTPESVLSIVAENESLRKDAERYRWTGISGNWVSCHLGKWRAHIEERTVTDWHDSRDDAIDAAISSPENHPK